MTPVVAILDYGSGNIRSAQRALETTGALVEITSDFTVALNADGLLVPGVGAFGACVDGIRKVNGDQIIGRRLAGGRPVLGICVGMQVLFDGSTEYADQSPTKQIDGLAEWPGVVDLMDAPVLPHMGWNTVSAPANSVMFDGIADERFYFVHSYAVKEWELPIHERIAAPLVTTCDYGDGFVAAVENGPLWATQFHPEKSGDAGLRLLKNWVGTLTQDSNHSLGDRA